MEYATAYNVANTLETAGFRALFAGGWVRDRWLQRPCADIDIATNARPEEVMHLFPKTIAVGARFGVVVVVVDGYPVEVSTFRSDGAYIDGRHPEEVFFSDEESDAHRRDFTVNGLFMEPSTGKLLDYVGGMPDLQQGLIRAIGDPYQRFREDHLRLLRAVRFATTLHFEIEPSTEEAIRTLAPCILEGVSIERIVGELRKMHYGGTLQAGFVLMQQLGLLHHLLPDADLPDQEADDDLPLILHLCRLIRHKPPQGWGDLAVTLKLSGEERKMAQTLAEGALLCRDQIQDKVRWAHYLAQPWAEECLEMLASFPEPLFRLPVDWKELYEALRPHIARISERRPLVTAAHLSLCGIPHGPEMGTWLRHATECAITQDLHSPEQILQSLGLAPCEQRGE